MLKEFKGRPRNISINLTYSFGKLEDDKISVTMSCDHRGIDGAVGARFLQTLSDIVAKADI